MQFTWIDFLFLGVFVYFAVKGWSQGVIYLSASLLAFAASLFLALRYSEPVSYIFSESFGITNRWAGVLAYFLIAFAAEALLSEILSRALAKTPEKIAQSKANQFLGAFVSATSGLFLVTLVVFMLLVVPLRGNVKRDIQQSYVAPRVISLIEQYGGPLPRVLNKSAKELTQFLTVTPGSTERVELPINPRAQDLEYDEKAEETLVSLVNKERSIRGIAPLSPDIFIREVSRSYSRRMFMERFFSHFDPDGQDVGDRLDGVGMKYLLAGENLAYAPDVETAHEGFMKSEGHKRNILDPEFHRAGIGIVDGGIWGIMVTQIFAD